MTEESTKAAEHVGQVYEGEQGRYEILETIGSGGMGSVTLAETLDTGRRVAIKFLHDELSTDGSSSRDRFVREIRVLQDLKAFRGIVQIEDWGETPGGTMFLVMEHVAAPTLDRIIEDHPQGLPQIQAVQIIIEILSVLEPIHHRKFVHRDLKPHNICVYQEPLAIRMLDFGLSKPFQEGLGYEKVTRKMQGKGNEIPGSPHYMAVEQFLRPKDVDARTDLYAVGVVLYELLAGIPPFRGIYLQDILKQHKEKEPPPIESCADGGPISYRLQAVIDKSLAKKPESRYQSAGEFKEALYDVLNMLNKQRRPRKALDNRYRIIRKIGQGGNSEVFEAENLKDGARVALKIAREGNSDWDEETLMNEADRALNHENIVRVYEFGSYEDRPALVMELLEGGTLEDILEQYRESGLPEGLFYRTMVDICRGLHHAHQSNIVHRDVKPGNMLRSVEGRTKVCDFGIAKRFEQQGEEVQGAKNTTLAKGTAQYISPEQCDLQGRVDRRADIYCLGVMMYEMLSGKLPFTEGILIMQHLQADPPPLQVRGTYKNPDALCAIVERAMHKQPDQRFQSMKELAQELVRISKLEAQKKPHKPVPLSTVPEEWKNDPARAGVVASPGSPVRQAGTAGRPAVLAKKPAVIAAAVAVVVLMSALVYKVAGSADDTTDPGPETPPSASPGRSTDEVAARVGEWNQLYALVDRAAWPEVLDFELVHLADQDDDLRKLIPSVRTHVDDVLRGGESESRPWPDELPALDELAAVIVKLRGDGELAASMKGLSAAMAPLSSDPAADAAGFLPWGDEAVSAARAAVDVVEKAAGQTATVWREALDDIERGRFAHNHAQVLKLIKETRGALPAPVVAALGSVLERAERAGAAPGDAFDALRRWTAAGAAAAGGLSAGFSFLNGPACDAAGVPSDSARLFTAVTEARSRGPNVSPRSRLEAVALGVLDFEGSDPFKTALCQALGTSPEGWAAAVDRLESESRVPVDVFRTAIAQAASGVIESAAFRDEIKRRASAAGEDQKGLIEAVDRARDEFLTKISGTERAKITGTLDRVTAEYRKGDVERDWERVTTSLAALDGADVGTLALDELHPALEAMRSFVNRHPDGGDRINEAHRRARQVVDELARGKRWLSTLVLARRHAELLDGDGARAARARAAFLAALTSDLLEEDFTRGVDLRRHNLAWSKLETRCVFALFGLPAEDRDLLENGTVVLSSGHADVTVQGAELSVLTSPAYALGKIDRPRGDLELRVELVLKSESLDVDDTLELVFAGPEKGSYDFEPPQLDVRWGRGSATPGYPVTLDVFGEDDGAQLDVALEVNGKTKKLTRSGESFAGAIVLDDLNPATGERDDIVVRAADAFGNAVERRVAREDIVRLRRRLVDDEATRIEDLMRPRAGALPASLDAGGVSRAAELLRDGGSELAGLKGYDVQASRLVGERLFNQLALAVGRWISTGGSRSQLESMQDPINSLLEAMASFGREYGADSAKTGELRTEYAAKLTAARSGGSRPAPNPNDGGGSSSGGSGDGDPGGSRGGTGTTQPPPPRRTWKTDDVRAFGLTFHYVEAGGTPAWISEVEVSHDFAQTWFRDAISAARDLQRRRFKNQEWVIRGDQPLVPVSPKVAIEAIAELNRTRDAQTLSDQCGGPVKVDLPTVDHWQAAAAKQTGGRTSGYAWGAGTNVPRLYQLDQARGKYENYFKGVHGVREDDSNLFHFLSGNAGEICRRAGTNSLFYIQGGSMLEATSTERRHRNRLRIEKSTRLNGGMRGYENLSGFRLAIVPQ